MTTSILLPPAAQRILVIFAHPDDAESYCGGTMARLAHEECEIMYLAVTRGDKGSNNPSMTPERLSPIRENEQRQAASILGVQSVTFLAGYYDGMLVPDLSLRKDLTLWIRKWRPDVVFTFDPWKRYELHPDHRATGICAFDALAVARDRFTFPDLNAEAPAHNVKQIYFFNTDEPNHWVDISNVIDKKIEARCAHASQVNPANPPDGYLRRWGVETGKACGYAFAEAFHHLGL
ncbi:PIG-L family deacetylase [Ktedonosporobacter rubrisoli]|uniref:PIG-L family deacetylase n=1 Tax=Ktedonosporobacter rubrisoli TaxID=2509675 RepID=A0A4P6JL47_KTERU|nr:PIG-L deacetylase family protein [Ktedonosporobacter rubrisoli]QBD75919.1 PIG-L family deacetylase [Ktedonosporobacter rubrisoli]